MADLRTRYVGLELECPIVVASAGITETVERMRRCQDNGAAAVVMKSWFEEEVSRRSPTPRFAILRHDLLDEKSFTLFSYEQASGWDLARKKARALHYYLPAGSVFFFESARVPDKSFTETPPGSPDAGAMGFGAFATGNWDYV